MFNTQTKRQSQKGNVLFLILIAVALFAALSYVVTQSTRSGGGSTEREKNILSSAQMTQYPTALRTAIIRMILGGVSVENVKFDAPGTAPFTSLSSAQLVFHPQGGGASYQQGPADLSASGNSALTWYYNANFYVPGIGINSVTGSEGNDVVAFLPGVSAGVCRQVNEELGIAPDGACTTAMSGGSSVAPIITAATNANIDVDLNNANAFPVTVGTSLECTAGVAFNRQASGCFRDGRGTPVYVFYSVLLER